MDIILYISSVIFWGVIFCGGEWLGDTCREWMIAGFCLFCFVMRGLEFMGYVQ